MVTQAESMALPPRLPLMVTASNRAGSTDKDARLVNCYLEMDDTGELWIYKRPGLGPSTLISESAAGAGAYYWRGHVYTIFGNSFYRDGVLVHTGLNTFGGIYKFDANLGATPQLVFGNGQAAYTYTEGGAVVGPLNTVDADYPVATVKGFAYLDGYTFVMTRDAYILNSELNNISSPTSWNPINFIRAQIEPDNGVFIAKQLVYVVAFKEWTTEFFFNAGNAAGSPLGPVQGMKVNYGCASQDSVRSIDDVLFWLCTNKSASLQVMQMDKGAAQIVSTPAIDRLLANIDYSVVYSWNLKITGHSFYVLTFPNSNLTLAYDIVYGKWFQWTDSNGNYFPIIDCTYDATGKHLLQHATNGRVYECNVTFFKDLNDFIDVNIITPVFDAGTRRRKQMNQLEIVGDLVEGSALEIRSTDNDYKSWSGWRTVNLGVNRPVIQNEGTFVRRAYHLRHRKDTFFRIQAVEVQYDIGVL